MNPTNPYEEHWTPSTRDVRMSYTDNRYQEWGAEMEEADAEFDRWLNKQGEPSDAQVFAAVDAFMAAQLESEDGPTLVHKNMAAALRAAGGVR